MVRLAAVVFEPGGIGRSRALDVRKISEDCYLRNPKNLLLCALLTAKSISLFACSGSTGTSTGDKLPPGGTAPAITQQPASLTVTAGEAATFSVMATGTAPLSYQWFMNGAASGTDSNSFSIAKTTSGQTGAHIDVTVTNAAGAVTSAMVTLTVTAAATAPTITEQPASETVTAGQAASFSVTATGTAPLSYQWFVNGTASGTNSSTFSIAQTTTAQNGAHIDVKVSNATGSVTSTTVTLTVNATAIAPAITQQPANVTATAGQAAAFSVTATGTAPLTYQWVVNGTASGTNSNTFSIAQTTTGQSGAQIHVKVTNTAGSATSNTVTLTVNAPAPTAPTIATQPTNATVTAGQSATFSVTATGTAPLTYQWSLNGAAAGTNSNTFTISQTTLAQTGAQIFVTVTNTAGHATSQTVTLTVNTAQTSAVNVLTYHNDVARTGQNLNESTLTTANVKSASFGLVGNLSVDAGVDAEPLYVSNLTLAGGVHNVVYVVTENDSVYAFDADTFAQLWHVSVLGANETASDNRGCGQVSPIIGITATPVIDLSAGTHGEIFLVAMSLDSGGSYHQRLHALDLSTGAEISGSPTTIQATFPNKNGTTTFDPKQYKERAALLLLNGVIYTTWASHCDDQPYQGWIMGYNETTLQQSSVLNVIANGIEGAIWMAGDGPAADSSGNIYFLDGNGTFDDTLNSNGMPEDGDYG